MLTRWKEDGFNASGLKILFAYILLGTASIWADVTYTLHLDGVDQGIPNQIEPSVAEAVGLYNQYGSFNKHLNISYTD